MGRSITDRIVDTFADPFNLFGPGKRKKYNIEDYNTKSQAEQIRGMAKQWQDLIAARLREMEDGSDVRETLQRRGLADLALSQAAPPTVAEGDSTGRALFEAQRNAMRARGKIISMSDEAARNAGNKAKMATTKFFRGIRDSAIGNTMSLAGALQQVSEVNDMVSGMKREGLANALGSVAGGALGYFTGGQSLPSGGSFGGLDWSSFPKFNAPSIGVVPGGYQASISPYNSGWAPQPSLTGGPTPSWFAPSLPGM